MMDFLFFVKTFFLTIAIILVLQIQVGDKSLESHAMSWVQTSAVTAPLNTAATGGVKLIRDMTAVVSSKIRGNNKPPAKAKKEEARSSFRWLWQKRAEEDSQQASEN